jgi:hypothetical protein
MTDPELEGRCFIQLWGTAGVWGEGILIQAFVRIFELAVPLASLWVTGRAEILSG